MSERDAKLAEAIACEQAIAVEARGIRDEASADEGLTADLFMQLYPLLCKPIPEGFIQTIPATKGKPYESTGIRSVQVQIDRMNNVLTPLWWWDHKVYEDGGKLCEVTVLVGKRPTKEAPEIVLTSASSYGGVGQGSSAGNIFKGSYTNAAKLAFARLGPGHEVYLGAADLDPDVNQEVADQKPTANGGEAKDTRVGVAIAGKLVDRVWDLPAAKEKLQLAASHVAGRDVGDCGSKRKATDALATLSFDEAEKVQEWIGRKEAEAALPPERVAEISRALEEVKPQLAEGGQNWLDGLNGILGKLKAGGIGPGEVDAGLGRLTEGQASSLETELAKLSPGGAS